MPINSYLWSLPCIAFGFLPCLFYLESKRHPDVGRKIDAFSHYLNEHHQSSFFRTLNTSGMLTSTRCSTSVSTFRLKASD
ncbi:hypothetical protein L596_023625 [Steinernema carpocapsae]|uniref:Uncharacterized protein n=1 Tax=Steinernema carpocapsae TaxID=34508 RepID=A0A4U5ME76_STECR|nr:hypothetical protein L596_023625 [Steinernema carpocapsae]